MMATKMVSAEVVSAEMMAAEMMAAEMMAAEMMAVVTKAEWRINRRQIDVGIEAISISSVAAVRMMPVTMPA